MFTDLSLPASRHDGVREADAALAAQSDRMRDFANSRQAADRVVYFTTLAALRPPRRGSNATSIPTWFPI